MNEWLASCTSEQAIAEMEKARVPAGPVLTLDQVLNDPQVKARELLKYIDHPGAARPVPLANTAVQLSDTPPSIRQRAALLGEHTDEVLREIGYWRRGDYGVEGSRGGLSVRDHPFCDVNAKVSWCLKNSAAKCPR